MLLMDEKVRLDRIQKLLQLDDARWLFEWLYEHRNRAIGSLRNATELLMIGRQQGKLELLEQIFKLKED